MIPKILLCGIGTGPGVVQSRAVKKNGSPGIQRAVTRTIAPDRHIILIPKA
jgi:hypothetical protein